MTSLWKLNVERLDNGIQVRFEEDPAMKEKREEAIGLLKEFKQKAKESGLRPRHLLMHFLEKKNA